MNLFDIAPAQILDAITRRPYFLSPSRPARRLGCFTKARIDPGKRKRLQQIQKMSRVKNRKL